MCFLHLVYSKQLTSLLMLVAIPFGAARAAIFDIDDRVVASTAPGSPLAPIGIVSRGDLLHHYTTGTLISPCHVLTSQHLFGSRRPIGRRVAFTTAVGLSSEITTGGTVIASGGYEKHRAPGAWSEAVGNDWSLLRLDRCLGNLLGFAKLRTTLTQVDELLRLSSAGYPIIHSGHSALRVDPSCKIRSIYALVWLNDCATMPGNSGGPIFRVSEEGGRPLLELYAIQSRGSPQSGVIRWTPGYENVATPALMFAARVNQAIEADLAVTGRTLSDAPRPQ